MTLARLQRWSPIIAVIVIAAAALVFRLPKLTLRPLHNDEAVNTIKYKELHQTGRFKYDPHEYHGPTLYYLTAPLVRLSGAKTFADTTETPYRLVPLVFSIALILLTLALRKELGPAGIIFAALYDAASPALTFHSRYYIHETLLVFFTAAALISGWRLFTTRKLLWSLPTGLSLGLMWATKETWILPLAAAGGGIILTWLWSKLRKGTKDDPRGHRETTEDTENTKNESLSVSSVSSVVNPAHEFEYLNPPLTAPPAGKRTHLWVGLLAAAAITLLTATLLFTHFFSHPRGILDAVLAYKVYFTRGAGGNTDHVWPFNWYLHRLTWFQLPVLPTARINRNPVFSELAIVALAAVGALFALLRRKPTDTSIPFARFLTFYTLLLTLTYSILPYKTPWCALGFLHGMTLLAGYAVAQLIRITPTIPGKVLAALVLLLPVADLVRQSDAQNDRFHTDPRNPWVYAHTSGDIETLVYRMNEIAKVHPRHENVYVQVVTKDCWPIPWYLRKFPQVGYWPDPAAPPKLDADVIIGPVEMAPLLSEDETGRPRYYRTIFSLRPGYFLGIYTKRPLWEQLQQYWSSKPPPPPPTPTPPRTRVL
jgi:uncharacterized protein (TIGR03663 family)